MLSPRLWCRNLILLGADIVTYSATKHLDGQGRCMGGAILCSQAFYEEHLEHYIRHLGPSISPYNAWSLAKSMETLDLRVRHVRSCLVGGEGPCRELCGGAGVIP